MRHFKRIMFMTLFVPALILSGAACSDDDGDVESNSNASQESNDAVSARIERNEQMFALVSFRKLSLHDMAEGLNDAGTIDPSYSPNTREAVRLLALTDWGQFQEDAEDVRASAEALLTALADEDIDAAAAAATALHDGEHEFSETVWNELAKELPPDLGGPEEDSDEEPAEGEGQDPGAEEPSGDEAPAAEATP